MTILQASFPYCAQLEKIRVALRCKDLAELYQRAGRHAGLLRRGRAAEGIPPAR